MPYTSAQPRGYHGRFGSGTGTAQPPPGQIPVPPAIMAEAQQQIAASTAKAAATRKLTPKQRAQQKQVNLARRIMAARKRALLAKVRKAQAEQRHLAAVRRSQAASRAGALAAGRSAGQRAPEGRTALAAPSAGASRYGSQSQVQSNLRRYLAGRGGA